MSRSSNRPGARPVGSIATTDDAMTNLARRVRQHERLNRLCLKYLDPECGEHCQVACVRDGTLVLFADSSAWAARLRLQSGNLLSALQAAGETGIVEVKIRVQALMDDSRRETGPRPLSDAARRALARFEKACPDEELQAIARRMLKRAGRQ